MFALIEIPKNNEAWLVISEAAEFTGYHRNYLQKMALKMWLQPESERLIRLRKRSGRYELWLPDLLNYIEESGRGPQPSRK